MKKTSAYYDLLTKRVKSRYSGILKVSWRNGQKVLDSENANYSYDALERVLAYGLSRIRADRSAAVLVLGLGGGSVLKLLRKDFNYHGKITAVEIDPAVIQIAENEFNLKEYEPLEIACADAFDHIKENSRRFGLIIVDLFIHTKVPSPAFEARFWNSISKALDPKAKILFNAGILNDNEQEIERLIRDVSPTINFKKEENVEGRNTLLLGSKRRAGI